MSWHGPQGKGAKRERRQQKRYEAEERNALRAVAKVTASKPRRRRRSK